MKKAVAGILLLLLIFGLAITASATTGVTGGEFNATVSSDGSCLVTMEMQLHMEAGESNLVFPLPSNAKSITINGKPARTTLSGSSRGVKLSSVLGNVTGDFSIRLQYTLNETVEYNESGKLILTLPMLSGFYHPIQDIQFTITLPADFELRPVFSSGYYSQTIESSLDYEIMGSTISGKIIKELKDRETLVMTMEVPETVFPQNPVKQWRMGVEEILMIVLSVLAALYWAVFLRSLPFLSRRSTVPPEGYTAGELSGLLTGYGNNLTMMVFSWAQLGYILIHVCDSGRVTLHKRMDMGNERDPEEVRVFRSLFGNRRYIDGTGYHYAALCRKAASGSDNARDLYKRSSGNPVGFRVLCALIGMLSGISLGRAIVGNALLGILLIAILAAVGGIASWLMQDWVKGLHMNDKAAMTLGLSLAGIWTLLGAMAGIWNVTLCVSAAQLLCGLATAYGGRRTPLGRQTVSQFLGFRKYLKKLPPKEAQRISRSDPDYFFAMAPYALAMGVVKQFAASFKSRKLNACPYLTTGMDGHLTATEWSQVMERAMHSLDHRQKRLFLERFMGR